MRGEGDAAGAEWLPGLSSGAAGAECGLTDGGRRSGRTVSDPRHRDSDDPGGGGRGGQGRGGEEERRRNVDVGRKDDHQAVVVETDHLPGGGQSRVVGDDEEVSGSQMRPDAAQQDKVNGEWIRPGVLSGLEKSFL